MSGSSAAAQGGWRQWDIHLRDGTRIIANPLGAPDDAHLSISVAGYEGHDSTIARSRIDYISAPPAIDSTGVWRSASRLPAAKAPMCEDVVVQLNGERTVGRVTLTHIVYSEGVVSQRDTDIDLKQVAYIQFASAPRAKCSRRRRMPYVARLSRGIHDL